MKYFLVTLLKFPIDLFLCSFQNETVGSFKFKFYSDHNLQIRIFRFENHTENKFIGHYKLYRLECLLEFIIRVQSSEFN